MTEANKTAEPLGLASTAGLGLVERLRLHDDPKLYIEADELMSEAADEIERQKVRIDGLLFDALGEPRTRYVRVTLDGSHCVMHPSEGDRYLQDAKDNDDSAADRYIVRDVWLSEREFDDLPEFDGF